MLETHHPGDHDLFGDVHIGLAVCRKEERGELSKRWHRVLAQGRIQASSGNSAGLHTGHVRTRGEIKHEVPERRERLRLRHSSTQFVSPRGLGDADSNSKSAGKRSNCG